MKKVSFMILLIIGCTEKEKFNVNKQVLILDSLYTNSWQSNRTIRFYDTISNKVNPLDQFNKSYLEVYYDSVLGVKLIYRIGLTDKLRYVYSAYFLNKKPFKLALGVTPPYSILDSSYKAFYYFQDGKLIFSKAKKVSIPNPEKELYILDSIAKEFEYKENMKK